MNDRKLNVLCFIARKPGLYLLDTLLNYDEFNVVGIFTHSKLPSSDDPNRGLRPEYPIFKETAAKNNIPFFIVDYIKDAAVMDDMAKIQQYDLLLSLNWKFLVPEHILCKSRIGDINLHRGLLPDYAGLEPIRRMLEDGLDYATITAHLMNEEYDKGEILYELNHPVNRKSGESVPECVDRVKNELVRLYPVCAFNAINILLTRNKKDLLYV
ncbi:hypothetical protein J7L67_05550 [bacterium]|nr:hypothetical protein [bacterium]